MVSHQLPFALHYTGLHSSARISRLAMAMECGYTSYRRRHTSHSHHNTQHTIHTYTLGHTYVQYNPRGCNTLNLRLFKVIFGHIGDDQFRTISYYADDDDDACRWLNVREIVDPGRTTLSSSQYGRTCRPSTPCSSTSTMLAGKQFSGYHNKAATNGRVNRYSLPIIIDQRMEFYGTVVDRSRECMRDIVLRDFSRICSHLKGLCANG